MLKDLNEARQVIKAEIKRQGMKVSHFRDKDITKAAKELMEGTSKFIPKDSPFLNMTK